jgi:hypothetical protein
MKRWPISIDGFDIELNNLNYFYIYTFVCTLCCVLSLSSSPCIQHRRFLPRVGQKHHRRYLQAESSCTRLHQSVTIINDNNNNDDDDNDTDTDTDNNTDNNNDDDNINVDIDVSVSLKIKFSESTL